MKKLNMLRYCTLGLGLIIAALLTSYLLSSSKTMNEFWIELFTGSGLAFILYSAPYIIFFFQTRKIVSIRENGFIGLLLLILSGVIVLLSVPHGQRILPQDVPIFPASMLFLFLQIISVSIIRIKFAQRHSKV